MSATDLLNYVGAPETDETFVESCWTAAQMLVLNYVGDKASSIPVEVIDRAILEVGSELFHRRNAPNGVAQFNTFDGSAIRVARDPMVGARPILRPFVGFGVA